MLKVLLPRYAFLIAGSARHKDRLQAFERALLNAGPLMHNLVSVSSILPSKCKIIPPKKGFNMLTPGQITFCVMAKQDTDKSKDMASASVGIIKSKNINNIGYISEYCGNAQSIHEAGNIAKKLALEMFATKFNIPIKDIEPKILEVVATSIKHSGKEEWVCAVALCIFII